MTFTKPSLPSPSMVVALLALVLAAGGVAVASIPGPDGAVRACVATSGQIGVGSPLTPYAVPKGSVRIIDSDASCGSGEKAVSLGAPQNPIADAPIVFGSRSANAKKTKGKLTKVTSNAVPEGQYLVTGSVRVSHPGGLEQDQRVKCELLGPDGKALPASTVFATFEKGADAGDATIPIEVLVDHVAAGTMTLACEEIAVAGGDAAASAAKASATRGAARAAGVGAEGKAVNSQGVVSGNVVQAPAHVPVNVCGNTINVVGGLNPAHGNTCVNDD
jgi:hypothetical protein